MAERPAGIDPRGPRFAASITALLLLVALLLALVRADAAATVLLVVIAALFAWSILSPATAPWGVLYRRVIRPRLNPPRELEDPRPPRFAQGVGFVVVAAGLLLHALQVPWALSVAAGAAFLAAFLNAAFGLCLGCQLYLLLLRAGVIGRGRPA